MSLGLLGSATSELADRSSKARLSPVVIGVPVGRPWSDAIETSVFVDEANCTSNGAPLVPL
jgi:hypothetical protein